MLDHRNGARDSTGDETLPLVSVVVPTYNRVQLLRKTVDSILSQTFKDFELLIIDNMSTDGTEAYVKSLSDARVRYFKNENHGVIGVNRNVGIRQARGECVAFCDDDDVWFPNKLDVVFPYFTKKESPADLLCHDILVRTPYGEQVSRCGPYTTYRGLLFLETSFFTSATAARREKLLQVSGFSEEKILYSVEDYDLWLRLAKAGAKICYHHEVLAELRAPHEGRVDDTAIRCENALHVLQRHFEKWDSKNALYGYLMRRTRSSFYRWAGNTCRQRGNFFEARRWLSMALREDPLNWKAWMLMLMSLSKLGGKTMRKNAWEFHEGRNGDVDEEG